MTPDEHFAGHPLALAVFDAVRALVEGMGGGEIRTTKSQVTFRRRRSFAYLWLPGRYLAHPAADVVLSVGLGWHDLSPRWKEVMHPSPAHWMHHLEVTDVAQVDAEVAGWLWEAAERAS
jgi:Domain of unknown function (DUF5655)